MNPIFLNAVIPSLNFSLARLINVYVKHSDHIIAFVTKFVYIYIVHHFVFLRFKVLSLGADREEWVFEHTVS